jgi:hypothetical protein
MSGEVEATPREPRPRVSTNYIERIGYAIGELVPGCRPDLLRFYALLVLTRGTETTGKDVHDAWAAWMSLPWNHPNHRSLVPYDNLEPDVQALDEPYVEAIREVALRALDSGEGQENG